MSETAPKPVYVGAWLDAEPAAALSRAASDAGTARNAHVARLLVEALQAAGYLPSPRRYRGPGRRRKTA